MHQAAAPASPPSHRIAALDSLRGIAVAGIVPMNVLAFSMPAAAYVNPRAFGLASTFDEVLWALGFLFVEDKFRALFAMLFGAGIAILLERAKARPLRSHPLRGHMARMAALLLIALAHAVLLADNDVLRSYAVIGLVIPVVLSWPVRRLLVGAACLMAGQFAVSLWFAWEWLSIWWDGTNVAALDQAERLFGANPQAIAATLERAQESLSQRVERRLGEACLQLRAVAASVPSTLAAMMTGVALWRTGLFAGTWEKARLFKLAGLLGALALPALAAMMVWTITSRYSPIVTAFNVLVLSAPFDLLLGIAYAALAMALMGEGRWAAVGRMALTNYLATSVIFAAMFAAWGLGLFGSVTRAQALALGTIPIAAMVLWSRWWLSCFTRGPAEWLWRSMAAGRML